MSIESVSMYSELLKLQKLHDFEGFAKCLVRYFPMVYNHENKETNKRICTFKISEKNKFKFASFQKHNGEVNSITLSVNREDF